MIEISTNPSGQAFLARLFAKQFAENAQLSDLIARFHPRSTDHPNRLFAMFDKEELNLIVDALMDAFVLVGLQRDNEPNELGRLIEDYVDIFGRPLVD